MSDQRLPTYFLSHGGGPWPWLKAERGTVYDALERSLRRVRQELGEAPRAVLMVSAHWETDGFRTSSAARPPMLFDYSGFPAHTYRIAYDAPGDPDLAERVRTLLDAGGLRAALDPERGYDHGTFSLMQPLYPDADMPLVQLSIDASLDPALHLEAGRLIAPLRDEGVAIVASGFSFHNIRAMLTGGGGEASARFDRWLSDALVSADPRERRQRLIRWAEAPAARLAHPREDHLIPLMVAVGAAGEDDGSLVYHQDDFMGAISASSFRFGDPVVRVEDPMRAASA